MISDIRKILKEPCENISSLTGVDEYSKRIGLLEHAVLLVQSAIQRQDLTDISLDNNVSKSQISKLDTGRPYQLFVEIFYELVYPYIMAHNYAMYRRFLGIIGIDSTFIRTAIRESGIYKRKKTEEGIKVHQAAMVFPMGIPLESAVTPANLNDSPEFEMLLENIDPALVKGSILTFDLGYYDLDRFRKLKEDGIKFVTRIKRNARYEVLKTYAHSSIIRFRNNLVLRLVSMEIKGEKKDYITDIMDIPDIYIHWIYSQRWNIEIFFRRMKSYLKIDHLISKKINGILVQIFTSLIAYLILMMIQGMLAYSLSIPEIIRNIRHGLPLMFRMPDDAIEPLTI